MSDDTVSNTRVAEAPAPAAPASAPVGLRRRAARPVFVDSSGRRQRRARRLVWLLAVPAVGYAALVVSSLLGGPTLNSPFLPLPQEPAAATRHHAPAAPSTGSTDRSGRQAASQRPAAGTAQVAAAASAARSSRSGGTVAARSSAAASSIASATPTGSPTATATATATPTHGSTRSATQSRSSTAPGASHRPAK